MGKEQYPISLSPLLDVSISTWRKQRGFDQLESAVLSLRNTHQVADLMELVRQEIPIDVDLAAQDSTKIMEKIIVSVYNIDNLNGSAFITAQVRTVQLKSEKLKDRPEGISLFRFAFSIDPAELDERIKQKPIFFMFCLGLTQHCYFAKEDRIEEIFSPSKAKNNVKSKMANLVGVKIALFRTPGKGNDTNSVGANGGGTPPIPGTPKMDALFGNTANVTTGYYGGLDFLHIQADFNSTFGTDPPILNSKTVGTDRSTETAK